MSAGKAGRAIDGALDHILKLRKRSARQESDTAAVEWAWSYTLSLLEVWSDAPLHERLKVVAEVRSIAVEMGLDELSRPELVLESELQLPGSDDDRVGDDVE